MDYALRIYLVIVCLLLIGQRATVTGTERCGYGDVKALETVERVNSYGSCFPYDTSSTPSGTPCDEIYTQQETYVFLSSRRAEGDFNRYLTQFQDTTLFFSLIPAKCINEARKILCHYYLPTCGNATVFEPPTSVCEDVCEHLKNICPDQFQQLALHFLLNSGVLQPLGLTMINCLDTGDYISPLQHCCSDLGIEIPCMNVNDSGDLVPDPACVTSESVVILSPSQSTQPDPGSRSVGVTVAIAIAILVAVVIVLAICLVLVVRLRRMHRKKKQVAKTSMSSFPSSQSRDSLRYHGANYANLLRPVTESSKIVARVPSAYIRQMADEKLLIPGRSLTLMDTIGQGEFGVVYRGNLAGWRAEREHSLVAVKTLKGLKLCKQHVNKSSDEYTTVVLK
jgi:hypothetical protein